MIVVIVFEPNGNPFGLNRKENCHHDHIPLNVKGNGNRVFSVQLHARPSASGNRDEGIQSGQTWTVAISLTPLGAMGALLISLGTRLSWCTRVGSGAHNCAPTMPAGASFSAGFGLNAVEIQHEQDRSFGPMTQFLPNHTQYTKRNLSKIRLYLPFFDWFGNKRTSVWIQINRKMVNTIWFRVDLIRFRKDFSVCAWNFYATIRRISWGFSASWGPSLGHPLNPLNITEMYYRRALRGSEFGHAKEVD